MFNQLSSLVGAALVLGAYVALQRGWLSSADRLYSAMNFVGAGLLTLVAIADQRVGFIILEGAWALLSLPGTVRRSSGLSPGDTGV